MMKGLVNQQHPVHVEENMSNLTSTSGEASAVSSGNRVENVNMYQQQSFPSPNPPPAKKKRNLPGNPDPEAEVIALSPKTLMATNRFVCEICNKGFQRDQNLQLHRRGHNLPWKLKQRSSKEVRKRVYICPESSCVHHHPSRALGDLTGIKKHFCRKHGEKKWKCDKCSKRYAVHSDWKAHSKTCGTREYRCDCGTLFSRRDSFITHRAFCDALAEESAKVTPLSNPLLSSQPTTSSATHFNLETQFPHFLRTTDNLVNTQRAEIPPWLTCQSILGARPISSNSHDQSSAIFSATLGNDFAQSQAQMQGEANPSQFPFHPTTSSHMSATALLQKATQMGATMSRETETTSCLFTSQQQGTHHMGHAVAASKAGFGLNISSRDQAMESGFPQGLTAFGDKAALATDPCLLQNMMNSLSSGTSFQGTFPDAFGAMLNAKVEGNGVGSDGLTRDFLGLRAFSHGDILNMSVLDPCMNSSSYEQTENQNPWQG